MTHIEKLLTEDGLELGCCCDQEPKSPSKARLLAKAVQKLRAFIPPTFTPKPCARKRGAKRIRFSQTIYVTPRGRLKPLCEFATVDKTQKDKPFISQFRGIIPRHVVGDDLNKFNQRCARMYREMIGRSPIR